MVNKQELKRLLKTIEEIPCVLPEEISKGIFYDTRRVEHINKEVMDSNNGYRLINGKKYYRLFGQDDLETLAKEFSGITLVSSHADNLQKESSYMEKADSEYINGCFDNASTNAVCTYLMKYVQLPKNVLFVFTADEEYDSEGAEHVSKKLEKYFNKENINVIVLDVTYGFRGNIDFTIENDYIFKGDTGENFIKTVCDVAKASNYRWDFLKKLEKKKWYIDSDVIKSYMGDRYGKYLVAVGPDETSEYKEHNFNAFSLCLPCSAENVEEMHSEKGFLISINTLCNYMDYLCKILQK